MPSVINSDDGVVSGSAGLKTSGASDGLLDFQSNGTRIAGITTSAFQVGTNNISAVNSLGFRNRIINGDMRIDQRNAGASGTANAYTVDRFAYFGSQASKGTWQQNAGSVTPPAGFTNYLGFTSSSAYSVLTTDDFVFYQHIEGFNFADMAFGTANAATITLSFWVRSSLTGTFGGSVSNSAYNRSYPFTFTINAANTWEQETITIPGDTSGTWVGATNATGLTLRISLGTGSNLKGTAGAWAAAGFSSATGAVNVVGTNGATFYITGVQLEAGSVATPFERRPYGTELMLCQRYYWKTYNQSVVPGSASSSATYRARSYSGSYAAAVVQFPVLMRAVPSCTLYNSNTGATNSWRDVDNNADRTAGLSTILDNAVCTESSSVTANTTNMFQIVASAEL